MITTKLIYFSEFPHTVCYISGNKREYFYVNLLHPNGNSCLILCMNYCEIDSLELCGLIPFVLL